MYNLYVAILTLTQIVTVYFQVMKKSVITADFEKKEVAPQYHITHNQLKKQRKVSAVMIITFVVLRWQNSVD